MNLKIKKDISKIGEHYKPKIRGKVKEHKDRNKQLFIVYKPRLVKVDANEEEQRDVVFFKYC